MPVRKLLSTDLSISYRYAYMNVAPHRFGSMLRSGPKFTEGASFSKEDIEVEWTGFSCSSEDEDEEAQENTNKEGEPDSNFQALTAELYLETLYQPPHTRSQSSSNTKLRRSLKGLLNRCAIAHTSCTRWPVNLIWDKGFLSRT